MDSSSLPVKQQRDNAAENVPDRKNQKIIPGRKNPKRDGAARMVDFFTPLRKNAASREDNSFILAKKQKNIVEEIALTRKIIPDRKSLKKDGAVKTVEFFTLPRKNATNAGAIFSLLANKQKNTAGKNVPTRKTTPGRKSRKIIHDRKNPKKDGAVKMVRFSPLIC